jgi:hypothetical protein
MHGSAAVVLDCCPATDTDAWVRAPIRKRTSRYLSSARLEKLRGTMLYCRYCQERVLVAIGGSGDRQYLACRVCGAVPNANQKQIARMIEE